MTLLIHAAVVVPTPNADSKTVQFEAQEFSSSANTFKKWTLNPESQLLTAVVSVRKWADEVAANGLVTKYFEKSIRDNAKEEYPLKELHDEIQVFQN